MNFEFATATRIVFGAGKSAEAGPLAASLGTRALLITGANPTRSDGLAARLAEAGIAMARVNDLADVWQHEQLRARGRFVEVDTPGGPLELLAEPFGISEWSPGRRRIPALGEHDPAVVEGIVGRGASSSSI